MLDRDIHPIDRQTALLYFVAKIGPLQRSQVNTMAEVLYGDTKEGQTKNLADVAQRSGIALPPARRFFGDPAWVLRHLAIEYKQPEFEIEFSTAPRKEGEDPCFLDERAAGGGAPRPIVTDLLRLVSFGELHVDMGSSKRVFASSFLVITKVVC